MHSHGLTAGIIRGRGRTVSISRLRRTLRLASGGSVTRRRGVLRNVVHFNNRVTHRVVAPHVSIISLSVGTDFPRILHYIIRDGCSHVPICTSSHSGVGNVLCVGSLLPRLGGPMNFH